MATANGWTSQTNAKVNRKNFQNFSYFLGGIDDTHQNLDSFTPYIPGVGRIWMYRVPHYMNYVYGEQTKAFKTFVEAGYTSVGGIGDISVDFTQFQGGFAAQQFATVSSATDETNSISIQMWELTGSPIREYLDTWVSGVRDPRSGIAHYHGAIEDGWCTYGEINHTCEFVFVDMDPTAKELEYSCLLAHGFPQGVPKDHLNYTSGERSGVQMNCQFRISKYESPAINEVGQWYLDASKVEYNYLRFNPNITKKNVEDQAISYGNSSGNAVN